MAMIDGVSKLGIARNVKTDTASTDAAFVPIPANRYIVTDVIAHNALGGSSASATVSVRGGAGGTGTSVVADAALTGHTGATVVTKRTLAATATTPVITDDGLYIRVGTASGVAGTTCDFDIYGYDLS